jgi:hypothetical protein
MMRTEIRPIGLVQLGKHKNKDLGSEMKDKNHD